jgi:hypothetical protein
VLFRSNLQQVKRGEIACLFYAGNAVVVAPIGTIKMFDFEMQPLEVLKLGIHENVKKIQERFNEETQGKVKPSSPNLLTPINLVDGLEARKILDKAYGNYSF